MTTHDKIIAHLMNALDTIDRAAMNGKSAPDLAHAQRALAFIQGIAQQAQLNANAYRERNRDGYLVVKPEAVR